MQEETTKSDIFVELTYGGFKTEANAEEMEEQLKEHFKNYKVSIKRHEPEEDATGYPI